MMDNHETKNSTAKRAIHPYGGRQDEGTSRSHPDQPTY